MDKVALTEHTIAMATQNEVLGIIFSKDRAMQLDCTLRSFVLHCKDIDTVDLKVLYTTSSPFHERQYQQLMAEHKFVTFIRESNFRQDLMSLLSSHQYVLFLVDDNIFIRDFSLADVVESLQSNLDAIGFSLRLGKNTSYCYMLNSEQRLPAFEQNEKTMLKYDWTVADYDFGYPLEVSSSVYRVSDLMPLLTLVKFRNPNTLEAKLNSNKQYFENTANQLLCYKRSVAFCNPINLVQPKIHKAGNKAEYSSESLAQQFEQGYRIEVETYTNFIPNSCHQEVELHFRRIETNQTDELPAPQQSLSSSAAADDGVLPGREVWGLTSIVILNYNGGDHIRCCFESIRAYTEAPYELIVIDNASTDGSLDYLRSLQDIVLVQNPTNLGCPPARTQAMALARGDYVLLLDNDTMVTPGWLTALLADMQRNPELGLLGPCSNYVSGPQIVPQVPYRDVQGLESFARTFAEKNRGRLTYTARLVGFCILIRRAVIDKIGAPDPQFGKYGFEDDDYTWRVLIAGFKAAIARDVFIHHTGGPKRRSNAEYNQALKEAQGIFKRKWALPPNVELEYGIEIPLEIRKILAQPFDPARHYVPIPDQAEIAPLIYSAGGAAAATRQAAPIKATTLEQRSVAFATNIFLDQIIGFDDLKIGQRVKIKIKPGKDGALVALKIRARDPDEEIEIEGLIQGIDQQKNTLRLLNRDFTLPDYGLNGLKAGDRVKLKGMFSETQGFMPEKIKMKETTNFKTEEVQGDINKIDREKKTLEVIGFTVIVNENTIIL